MEKITLTIASFETLIKVAYLDGRTDEFRNPQTTAEEYLKKFYAEYRSTFIMNGAIIEMTDMVDAMKYQCDECFDFTNIYMESNGHVFCSTECKEKYQTKLRELRQAEQYGSERDNNF